MSGSLLPCELVPSGANAAARVTQINQSLSRFGLESHPCSYPVVGAICRRFESASSTLQPPGPRLPRSWKPVTPHRSVPASIFYRAAALQHGKIRYFDPVRPGLQQDQPVNPSYPRRTPTSAVAE